MMKRTSSLLYKRATMSSWMGSAACEDARLRFYGSSSSSDDKKDTTHFGYRQVPREEKQSMVFDVFKNVAGNYDLMNDMMSAGVHRYWKNEMVERLYQPQRGGTYLDVAGGTGDIAFRMYQYMAKKSPPPPSRGQEKDAANNTSIIVSDINTHMLEEGRKRFQESLRSLELDPSAGIDMSFEEMNAEALSLDDASVDGYSIAFGIRNVTNKDKALAEAFRVLKPGGIFVCLEFSQVEDPTLRSLYDVYSHYVIPQMGSVVMNDEASYRYLVESIRQFPNQEAWKARIQDAGFAHVRYENFTFGVAAIHTGIKLA